MAVRALLASLCLALAAPAFGQATSQWRSRSGIPVAVVEVPGGDLEHLVLVVPAETSLPTAIMGRAVSVTTQPGATVWTLSLPELMTVVAAREAFAQLAAAGAAVALGPVPARDLRAAFELLDGVAHRPPPGGRCVVADGALEILRGAEERVELGFAAPPPGTPEFPLTEALAAWLRVRLLRPFPGVRVETDVAQGCSRLLFTAPAGDDEPRVVLARLRGAVRSVLTQPATAVEVAAVQSVLQRQTARWATDGATVARKVADLLARGASAGTLLTPPTVTVDGLGSIARTVLEAHSGAARLVEQERRVAPPVLETLDNGVVVSWRWIPGEVAVAAVAFGGLEPSTGRAAALAVATAAASSGWVVDVVEVLGLNLVAVAVPAADVTAVLERVAESLATLPATPLAPLDAALADRLGLARGAAAESLALALALPIEADEAPEAAAKFFAGLAPGTLRSTASDTSGPLVWSAGPSPARVLAMVELPAHAPGLLGGGVLASRLAAAGVGASWVAAPGRLLLELAAEGAADVPALDAGLASAWAGARKPPSEAELGAAAAALANHLGGDLARVTARAAAAHFLPALPAPADLHSVEVAAVAAVLAELPAWQDLVRVASGPAPPEPPAADVRQSRPRRH